MGELPLPFCPSQSTCENVPALRSNFKRLAEKYAIWFFNGGFPFILLFESTLFKTI